MAVYQVFDENIKIRYKSTLCSQSSLLVIITGFLMVFLPFLIAYRSRGFWIKDAVYREQPTVRYKNKFFLYMNTETSDSPIMYTNYQHLQSDDCCHSLQSTEFDFNKDGKTDQLTLEFNILSSKQIYSAYIILVFDYILQAECKVQMQALGVVEGSIGLPGTKFELHGDLQLVQKIPFPCRGRFLRYNHTELDEKSNFNINTIVRSYAHRDMSLRIENQYKWWTTGNLSENDTFSIKMSINYPEQIIHYRPGFWGVMKYAWMQYFSLFVIFYSFCRCVKGFVFVNRLLPTITENPLKKDD